MLAIALPFVAVVVLTTATFVVRQQALDTRDASVRALENELLLAELLTSGHRAHTGAAMHAQTGAASWRRTYDDASARRQAVLAQLDDHLPETAFDDIATEVERHEAALQPLLAVPAVSTERQTMLSDAARRESALQEAVTRVTQTEGRRHERTRVEANRLNAAISAAGVLIGLVGASGGLVAVWFVSRQVVGRLRRVQTNAERLATGQDMSDQTDAADEIGTLARTIEAAGAAIREKDVLLDMALEVGGMVIFEVRPDRTVALRGEPGLLELVGARSSATTLPLSTLQSLLTDRSGGAEVMTQSNGDMAVRTVTGESRWVEIRSREQPIRGDHEAGTVVGVVADVTARHTAQEKLERAKEAAEQANRTKDEFLSRMSHELRTPLNAVLGFAQLLEMDELTAEQRESVTHILKGGRHLLALVNDVLDLARIESGQLSLSVEPTPLAEVVEEAVQLTGPLARKHSVRLVASGGSDAHALVDRRRTKQMLLNLLSNGIKYNHPGGTVELDWTVADGRVHVTVSDSGIGIDERQRADLFRPFARSDERTAEIEGSGLGLAVSRSLAEAMGGSLALAETGEWGSRFVIDLPDAGDAVARLKEHDGESAVERLRALGPLSVLHIEDNAANRRFIEELLRRAGSPAPMSAETGTHGLDLARRHRPDLVLLDRHLPDMLGEDVLHELSGDERTAHIPVVVITADAMDRSASVLRRSGAAGIVTKPVDAEEFWRTADFVLSNREGGS